MKKLNRRGYLTIEIVLAATLAFTIAFFLIDLTIKFANKTDDIQLDTLYITDNALLIENIREVINIDKDAEVENGDVGKITDINCQGNTCTFTFDGKVNKKSTLKIDNDNKEVLYTSSIKKEKPIFFETFTNDRDENDAQKYMNTLAEVGIMKAKSIVRDILGETGVEIVKKVLRM